MGRKPLERKKSEIIADFLQLLRECETGYQFNYEMVNKMDLLKTDIEHKFELEPLNAKERAALGKQLVACLKERREYKDAVEEMKVLSVYVGENRAVINGLTQIVGEMRKAEKYHAERTYRPRVLKEE